ncbi:MAG: hypothetical protein ACW99A_01305 [Candidatus Kariarchaeaceae archaeon]
MSDITKTNALNAGKIIPGTPESLLMILCNFTSLDKLPSIIVEVPKIIIAECRNMFKIKPTRHVYVRKTRYEKTNGGESPYSLPIFKIEIKRVNKVI